MKTILVTIDGSEYSKRAMLKAKEIARVFDSNIILLNVRNTIIPYLAFEETQKYYHMLKDNSETLLQAAKKQFSDMEDKVELVSLEGDIATEIIDYSENNDIDLVVMGSMGLSAGLIQGFLLGSIANKVVHGIKKPILIVK